MHGPIALGLATRDHRARVGLALILLVLAGACAQLAPRSPDEQHRIRDLWSRHRQQTSQLSEWTLQGRMAVRTPEDSWNAGVRWRQREDAYLVRVTAPLARGTVEITGDDRGVSLRTPQNETLTAADPGELFREHLGFELPVGSIRYWMRGLPAPEQPIKAMDLDDQGRLLHLSQGPWQLEFSRYENVDQYQLPGRVFLESDSIKVRVAVQRWRSSFE